MSTMEEEFIENVRMYKFLYDVHCQSYRDTGMRTAAWEEIGKTFQMTGEECKTLWTKLRNAYTNAIKRRRASNGQSARKIGKWKYEDQMGFVLPYIDTRTLTRNSPCLVGLRVNTDNVVMNEHDYTDAENDNAQKGTTTTSVATSSSLQDSSPYRLLKQGYSVADIRKKLEKCAETEIAQSTNTQNTTVSRQQQGNVAQDEVDMFYLSMARTIKQLPKIEQAKIRMQFCNLVSEAEIKSFPQGESNNESCATTSTTSSTTAEQPKVILIKSSDLRKIHDQKLNPTVT